MHDLHRWTQRYLGPERVAQGGGHEQVAPQQHSPAAGALPCATRLHEGPQLALTISTYAMLDPHR